MSDSVPSKRRDRAPSDSFAGLAACVGILVLILVTNFGKHSKNTGSSGTSTPVTSVSPISSPAAIPAPPQIVQRRSEAWLAMLKRTFLGVVDDRSSALDPAADGISVWADKRSGFYYCADSPYFAKLRPGSLVTQGHALQSGYQPKLGRYCR